MKIYELLSGFYWLLSYWNPVLKKREARLDKAAKAINKQGGKTKKKPGIFGRLKKTASK